MSRIAIDFDGTLVKSAWPGVGDPIPGAADAVRELIAADHHVYVYTARTSHQYTDGTTKTPAQWMANMEQVRDALDDMGLVGVPIWEGYGKPHYHLLIDDRAMRFPGRPNSWKRIVPAILARVSARG